MRSNAESSHLEENAPAGTATHTSDHLANERTFLAWIRTSIAMIGLGFVVARFSLWLRELAARLDEPARTRHTGLSLLLGIALMALGALLAVIAAWRYRRVRQAIERNTPAADERTVVVVTILVIAVSVALILYMVIVKLKALN